MSESITTQDLMRYVDGELAPDQRRRVEEVLAASTELQRQVTIFRSLKAGVQDLSLPGTTRGRSIWDRVSPVSSFATRPAPRCPSMAALPRRA